MVSTLKRITDKIKPSGWFALGVMYYSLIMAVLFEETTVSLFEEELTLMNQILFFVFAALFVWWHKEHLRGPVAWGQGGKK